MSLVSSYVYCEDRCWYKELCYKDKDSNWFICFDDDDPVEIVIKSECDITPEQVLNSLNFPYVKIQQHHSRLFDNEFHKARAYFITVKNEPFPTPRPFDEYDDKFNKFPPATQGVFYGKV